ncbi:hypothetical protein LSH36_42g04002 [Paralvinella palmiformis]|uniref:Uncharacterized protein n=1 Tax=Paralvinella palmiformis TaxID=53620 RepID=A0AAD9K7S5_9ANNE|nr:hypothetical protein LSH36_42g04002 [Paralvinella palmiformis]
MALEGATRTWIAQSNLKNLAKGSGSLKLVSLFHTHTRARAQFYLCIKMLRINV